MIIGITGTLAAGKGTIVKFLQKNGFKHLSVRKFIINELKERELKETRDNMVAVANELRIQFGQYYIMEKLINSLKKDENAVIESVRNIGEINYLKSQNCIIFAVDAEIKKRYERAIKRKSSTDNISFEKFVKDEEKEMENKDPNKQNLRRCIELSDYMFINEGTIEELYKKVKGVLNELRK